MMKSLKSFTLIELLIVIVIIGILAVALIPRLKGMQDKARWSRVQKDMSDFRSIIYTAQINTNKSLAGITGRHCGVHCNCRYQDTRLSGLPNTDVCVSNWIDSLRKIEEAANMSSGSLSYLEKDPRGSPYLLYELSEGHVYGCSRGDRIEVVGPDQVYTNTGGASPPSNPDNIIYSFPVPGCPKAY